MLKDIEGIHFQILTNRDVVRHHIVQAVVKAYEKYEERKRKESQE
ncbi:MAG TPA: PhoH family protein [Synergistales bacterium]|nr:PhoH family protein [Synergistales bacterium]